MKKLSAKKIAALVKAHGHIKVNLPSSVQDYARGNGEGIWAVIIDPADVKPYKENASQGQLWVAACNDSTYYPEEVAFGSRVLCELRGEMRPVAVWDNLQSTKEAPACRDRILCKLMDRRG